MNHMKKNKPGTPSRRTKPLLQERFPSLGDLVLDRSMPRVRVKVFPSRKKKGNKPSEQMVIELQCEV